MRRKPYTELGITRVPCKRCGKPSAYQWQTCATGSVWLGLCPECDIELNRLVVDFMGLPQQLSSAYSAMQAVIHNPKNSKHYKLSRGKGLTSRHIKGDP